MYFPVLMFEAVKWAALSSSARGTLLYLFSRSDDKGRCWPSISRIAKDMKRDRKTIILSIKELCKIGLIDRTHCAGNHATYQVKPVPYCIPVCEKVPVPEELYTHTEISTSPIPKGLPEQSINKHNNKRNPTPIASLSPEILETLKKWRIAPNLLDGFDRILIAEKVILVLNRERTGTTIKNYSAYLLQALRENWTDERLEHQREIDQKNRLHEETKARERDRILNKFLSGEWIDGHDYEFLNEQEKDLCEVDERLYLEEKIWRYRVRPLESVSAGGIL